MFDFNLKPLVEGGMSILTNVARFTDLEAIIIHKSFRNVFYCMRITDNVKNMENSIRVPNAVIKLLAHPEYPSAKTEKLVKFMFGDSELNPVIGIVKSYETFISKSGDKETGRFICEDFVEIANSLFSII
jgi:hypothetical protein